MMRLNLENFSLPNGGMLPFYLEEAVFQPNLSTKLLIRALLNSGHIFSAFLDLGCGNGIVGLAASRLGVAQKPVFASDISERAIRLTRKNAELNGLAVIAKAGSLFEAWTGMKFDCIASSVSAISENLANLSPWYQQNIDCNTGFDGTELLLQVLQQAPNFLTENGRLYLTIISLCNHQKILLAAQEKFGEAKLTAKQYWPLPKVLMPYLPQLYHLKENGIIDFEEKFGLILCWTSILELYNGKN